MSVITNCINANSTSPLSTTDGGLGVSNPTAHGILVGESSSAVTPIVLSAGEVLIGTTSSNPSGATLTAGTGISINSASGAITITNSEPFSTSANQTVSGTWTFSNATIEMTGLASSMTSDVVYYNTSTGLLTYGALSGTGWALTGNSVSSTATLGTTSAYGFIMETDSTQFFSVDASQNVAYTPHNYSVIAGGTLNIDSTGNMTIGHTDATNIFIGSNAVTSLTIASSGTSVGTEGELSLDGYDVVIGPSQCTQMHIGNLDASIAFMTDGMTISGLSSETGTAAASTGSTAPANVQPSGWATLIINTTNGTIAYWTQT